MDRCWFLKNKNRCQYYRCRFFKRIDTYKCRFFKKTDTYTQPSRQERAEPACLYPHAYARGEAYPLSPPRVSPLLLFLTPLLSLTFGLLPLAFSSTDPLLSDRCRERRAATEPSPPLDPASPSPDLVGGEAVGGRERRQAPEERWWTVAAPSALPDLVGERRQAAGSGGKRSRGGSRQRRCPPVRWM